MKDILIIQKLAELVIALLIAGIIWLVFRLKKNRDDTEIDSWEEMLSEEEEDSVDYENNPNIPQETKDLMKTYYDSMKEIKD
jgi:uncharacterized membrane protein YraQ (UPF0718 family)